jgi:hypothetical protein
MTAFGCVGVLFVAGSAWLLGDSGCWRCLVFLSSVPSLISLVGRMLIAMHSPSWSQITRPAVRVVSTRQIRSTAVAESASNTVGVISILGPEWNPMLTQASRTTPASPSSDMFTSEDSGGHATLGDSTTQMSESTALLGSSVNADIHGGAAVSDEKVWTNTEIGRIAALLLVCMGQTMAYWGATSHLPTYLVRVSVPVHATLFIAVAAQLPGLLLAHQLINRWNWCLVSTMQFMLLGSCVSLAMVAVLRHVVICAALFTCMTYFFCVPVYAVLNFITPALAPPSRRSFVSGLAYAASRYTHRVSLFVCL